MSLLLDLTSSVSALGTVTSALVEHAKYPVSFHTDPPISDLACDSLERDFSFTLPLEVRTLLTRVAGSIQFSADYSTLTIPIPVAVRGVHPGQFRLDGQTLREKLRDWQQSSEWWDDLFAETQTRGQQTPLSASDVFPIVKAGNGDLIVVVHAGERTNEIVYIDHEDGPMNWVRLGRSFSEFIGIWFRLGCVGPDYDHLEPFYDSSIDALSLDVPESAAWIRSLGLDGHSPTQVDVPLQFQLLDERIITANELICRGDRNVGELVTSNDRVALRIRNAFVWMFQEGVAPIKVRDRYGVIDRGGHILVEPRFEFISDFRDGRARARDLSGKDCVIDRTGKRLTD